MIMIIRCERCGFERQKYAKGLCMGCYKTIRKPNYKGYIKTRDPYFIITQADKSHCEEKKENANNKRSGKGR